MTNYYLTSGTDPVPPEYASFTIINTVTYEPLSAINGYAVYADSDSMVVVGGDVNDDVIIRTTSADTNSYNVVVNVLGDTSGADAGAYRLWVNAGGEGGVIPTITVDGNANKFDATVFDSPTSEAKLVVTENGSLNSYTGTYTTDIVTINGTIGNISTSLGTDRIVIDGGTVTGSINAGGAVDFSTNNVIIQNGGTVAHDITTGAGGDSIEISGNSTVGGKVDSYLGADTITIDGSTVTGDVDAGNAADISKDHVVIQNGSSVGGNISSGAGDDTVEISNGSMVSGNIDTYLGDDKVTLTTGSTVGGNIVTGIGGDTVSVADSHVMGTVSTTTDAAGTNDAEGDRADFGNATIGGNILTGGGNDTVTLNNTNVGGYVSTALGNDEMHLSGGVTISGSQTSDALIESSILMGIGADSLYVDIESTYDVAKPINLGQDGTVGVNEDMLHFTQVTDADKARLDELLGKAGFTDPDGDGSFVTDYASADHTYQPMGSGFGSEGEFTFNGADFINVDYTNYGWKCFGRGTLIEMNRGAIAIENLAVGDLVMTRDNGLQPIRWMDSSKASAAVLTAQPNLRPIRIQRHALGNNVPSSDLIVSPQHRILVRSKIAQKMFGTNEVLVAAKQLCQLDGIDIATDLPEVEYFHMLFDHHEVVTSNGAETESLYTGPEVLASVGPQAREELFTLFPQLKEHDYVSPSARLLASGRMGRKMALRHKQNGKLLVN